MTHEERQEWCNLKITRDTFKKTPEEKIALYEAKRKHKEFIRSNPNHTGIR